MFDVNKFFDAKRVVNEHTTDVVPERKVSDSFPEPDTSNTIITPLFVSPLLMTTLHKRYVKSMESVIAEESANQQHNGVIRSGRNCYQSNEDLHLRHESVKGLCTKIEEIIGSNFGLDVEIKDCWLNVNLPGGFNYEHDHSGIISGCFYIQVPAGSGDIVFHNPAIRSESFPVIQQYNERYMHVTPDEGDLIMFPPWLTHHVEPNATSINRVSISFNAFLKT